MILVDIAACVAESRAVQAVNKVQPLYFYG